MSTLPDDLIGKRLGQFEILDEIGRGGMATVYRARQPSINRMVAVKVLPRHFLHDPDFLERFKREVDVIAHLEHPHILPIIDYGEADGMPFIAMRFLAGGSMAQMLRRGTVALEALEQPLTQVAHALDHAHKQGIIHRDLKPGNILLDENGNAYLTDFGIARVLNSNLTGSAIIGTPAYMSPEQANGQPLDARSDIYSLGIVVFEMLSGREPYEAPTPMALLLKHITEPLPSIRLIRADVPVSVEAVITRATAKDPGDRYASASDLARAYSEALRLAEQAAQDPPTLMPAEILIQQPRTAAARTRHVDPPTMAPPAVISTPTPAPKRSILPWVIGFVVIVGVSAGALAAMPIINPPPTPVPLPPPTVFPDARVVEQGAFRIAVPNGWTQTDQSDDDRTQIVWRSGTDAFVSLALVEEGLEDPDDFADAVEEYEENYYSDDEAEHLSLVDEATAPDGTLRRSYRLDGSTDFPPGQMDVFYLRRSSSVFAIVEMYSADTTGNEFVPTFQQILDSLRLNADQT